MENLDTTTLSIKSLNDTQRLAFCFAKILETPVIFALEGEMGVGKTQFVKFFANFINLNQEVISPSFFKMQLYQKEKRDFLIHLDGYYLNQNDNLIMYWKYFSLPYVFIEWPQLFYKFLKKQSSLVIYTKWKFLSNGKRLIKITTDIKIINKIKKSFQNEKL